MIEQTPAIDTKSMQFAFNLLTKQEFSSLFAKIDDDYMYWDKVKYHAPKGTSPEILWHAVKLRRQLNVVDIQFKKLKFHFTITGRMQQLLHEFDLNFGGSLGASSIIPEKDHKIYLISSIMEEAIASS